MNVAVLGASNKPSRYSHMAVERLIQNGHKVFPVHKVIKEVLGLKVFSCLSEIKEPIDTLTVYVNEEISACMENEILQLKPKRIIFNPGTENCDLADKARAEGIDVDFACTLVLLSMNKF